MVFLQDIENIQVSMENETSNLINFEKQYKIGSILSDIKHYQGRKIFMNCHDVMTAFSYEFTPSANLQQYLSDLTVMKLDDINDNSKKVSPSTETIERLGT